MVHEESGPTRGDDAVSEAAEGSIPDDDVLVAGSAHGHVLPIGAIPRIVWPSRLRVIPSPSIARPGSPFSQWMSFLSFVSFVITLPQPIAAEALPAPAVKRTIRATTGA